MAYMTLEVLILRALFRPQTARNEYEYEHHRIFRDSLSCAAQAIELVSGLTSRHFAHFWPPCTFLYSRFGGEVEYLPFHS